MTSTWSCGSAFQYESLDVLYRLDQTIGDLIRKVHQLYRPEDVLWILVADHALKPIVEDLQVQGLTLAQRENIETLKDRLNKKLLQRTGIKNVIKLINLPWIYVDRKTVAALKPDKHHMLDVQLRTAVLEEALCVEIWHRDEIKNQWFAKNDPRRYLKNQIYKDRGGDYMVLVRPYAAISKYPTGTSHDTPFSYDTHVPCFVYQKNRFEHQVIPQRAEMVQLVPTLADILHVPRPSACFAHRLFGIELEEEASFKFCRSTHH